MRLKTRENKIDFLAQPEKKRCVLMAQDVIDSIRAQRLFARQSVYIQTVEAEKIRSVGWWYDDSELLQRSPSEVEVCQSIHDEEKACICCAKGALVMARLGYQHPVDEDCETDLMTQKYNNLNSAGQTRNILLNEFSDVQMSLIECAFERDEDMNDDWLDWEDRNAAKEYGESLSDDAGDRLIAIMENVIANNGTFVIPEKFYAE